MSQHKLQPTFRTSSELESYLGRLKNPENYLSGLPSHKAPLLKNLLIFLHTRSELLETNLNRRHHHHRHVLIISTKGDTSIVINSKEFHLIPGCAFLIVPHQIHWYTPARTKDPELLFITFECDHADQLVALKNTNVQLDEVSLQYLTQLLKLYTSGRHDDAFRNSEIQLTASLLFSALLRVAKAELPQNPQDLIDDLPLIDHINQYINQNMTSVISHADLAASLHCSVGHLRKRFRNTYGISLGDYITTLRLQRAKALLLQSKLLVKEIAFECGFSNNSSFNRFFFKSIGYTPLDYRRIMAEKGFLADDGSGESED